MTDIAVRAGLTVSGGCHQLTELTADSRRSRAGGEILVFAKCRNELLRLPAFLEHYRTLGAGRFFIIDNDSTDGTTDYLVGQADVRTFRTTDRFREARGGTAWLNALLREFGTGSWCVTADIDELLVFPGSEHASLRTFTRYLDGAARDAVSCLLLDLYPAGRLRDCQYAAGGDLLRTAPYFDPAPYLRRWVDVAPGVLIRGGMRERVFYPELRRRTWVHGLWDRGLNRLAQLPVVRRGTWGRRLRRTESPCLTKVPLVRWDKSSVYLACNHWISPKAVADETGALLHFKFLGDFHVRAAEEAARGEYYDNASEYRRYAEVLSRNPEMTFMDSQSTFYAGSQQLVELGLIRDTPDWAGARGQSATG